MKFDPRKVCCAFVFQLGFALIGVGLFLLALSLGHWVFIVTGIAGMLVSAFVWGKKD